MDDDDGHSEDEDLEIESYTDKIRSSKSAENLDCDDDFSNNASPIKETEQVLRPLRPLLSVASSPQLLNQIYEENESEEDDDFVPPNLNASRIITKRNSLASPEVIRKYEARRRRKGTGSRGTSCSSSDASDTDDTEGRSRKDKLKHKFAHRRDSSDHSSDTDGGPSGHGGGGFGKGLGGGGEGGGGPRKDDDDKGGNGGGKKDGKGGGSPKSGRHHHGRGKQNNLNIMIGGEAIHGNGRTSELSISSGLSNRSLGGSRSSLKYVVERDENVSDSDAEDNADNENEGVSEIKKLRETLIEKLNQENKCRSKKHGSGSSDFSSLDGDAKTDINKLILARCSSDCDMMGMKRSGGPLKVKMDINSNMCCKHSCKQTSQMKVETKCCSLV